MGLAASQARLLTITARKADCEFQSMKLSHEKIALSRDMEKISDEYQNAMNKTKLIYDYYGSETSEMALSYNLLMTPSLYNDYYPKLLTDNANRVVLSDKYAFAARAAGIPIEGYNGTPSSEVRNKFVEALYDIGVISASTAANIENVPYNNAIGLGQTLTATAATQDVTYDDLLNLIKLNCEDTSDYGVQLSGSRFPNAKQGIFWNVKISDDDFEDAKKGYPCACLVGGNNAILDVAENVYPGHDENRIQYLYSTDGNVTLYDLLSSDKEYVYSERSFWGASNPFTQIAYMQQLLVGNENSNSFLNWMVDQFSTILGGISENDLALEYAYNQVYDLLYPDEGLQDFAMQAVNEHPGYIRGNSDNREKYNGYEDDSDGWDGKIGALTSLYGTSVMGGYCEDTYDDYEGGVWRHAPQYLGIVYSNCGDGGWGDQRHSASVSLNNIAKVFMTAYIEYMDQMDDKYSYDMGSISNATLWDNSDDHIFKIKVGSDVDTGDDNLYANFYDTLFNRICMNGWSENDNVNKIGYMQELLKNGSVYISSINNDGNYYQNSYSTDTYIAEVADTEAIAQAEAKYNAAKARIEHKENTIDMKMKNLDTEISSLTTEYDTMKGLISKVIEKSFKRYEA